MREVLRRAGRALQVAAVAVLAVLLACNLWLIFLGQAAGEEHPTVFDWSAAVVVSGSMEPALSVGDLIVTRAQDDYAVGDVITFGSGGGTTTHRIIEVTEGGYVTRGDANNAEDLDLVKPDEVVGGVVLRVPLLGNAVLALRTPLGIAVLVFAGVIVFGLPAALDGRREASEGEAGR